jgi:hypothetical protein
MAVKIPTKAIIPIDIIKAVITALVLLAPIEVKAIFIFSVNVICLYQIELASKIGFRKQIVILFI